MNESRKQYYRQNGYWGDATLADYWRMAVLSSPEKIAVMDLQGTSYTYAELDDAASRVASFLHAAGIKSGDFVSFQLPGWSEFSIIYVACLKVGAVANPILPCYRQEELVYILNKCESKVFFFPSNYRRFTYLPMVQSLIPEVPSLKEVVVVDKEKMIDNDNPFKRFFRQYSPLPDNHVSRADDLAAVLFTSGTDGAPKGVMFTHNNIIASEKAFAAALNFNYTDIMLMTAPMAHATGFHHGVTLPFMYGAKSVLQDIFSAETSLALIAREKCTCSMGATPFVYDILRLLQNKKYDIASLRFFLCGGAPIPRHLVQESMKVGLKVVGVYGSTESVPHTVVRLHDSLEKVIQTDGAPVAGVELKVVDASRQIIPVGTEGEEASRGPNVFMGYLKDSELTARVFDEEGWYYSGDLCTLDEDGYIRITGRKKDVIIRGGENISSVEIENILLQMPNVYEAGVVGMPDPRLGERTCAYLVLNDCDKGIDLEDVKKFFAEKGVAKCKYPERIEIIDSLPRTASGKIKKYVLRQDIKNKLTGISQ
ncbi:medium-chain fatty-acid--CoA ligase [Sporomusa acidovorans]